MSYLTRYSLELKVLEGDDTVPQCEHAIPGGAKFCPECGCEVGDVPIGVAIWDIIDDNEDDFYGLGDDAYTWYMSEHDEPMRKLSAEFPFVLFTLEGRGQDSGDIWKKYYLGGRVHYAKAKIVIEDFDPAKLL